MIALQRIALTLLGAVHALYLRFKANPVEFPIALAVVIILIASLRFGDDDEGFDDGRIILSGDVLAVDALEQTYANYSYALGPVREGDQPVPRLVVTDLPDGLKDMRVIDRRKRLFFRTVLPMILIVNESITADRERMLSLADVLMDADYDQDSLNEDDLTWLSTLAVRYGIDLEDDDVTVQEMVNVLKLRVAPVPPSLALAQAVEESAWGTSRFAREGNALFGQWVWNEDAGIVPERQREGQEYAVKAFESPLQSVFGYAKNLNTHWAYTTFRERRSAMLERGEILDGWVLAETLIQYSERREDYIKSLHAIMRVNNLTPFDTARLAGPDVMVQLAKAE